MGDPPAHQHESFGEVTFSIVIPACNEVEGVARTVKAALAQNLPRKTFEVIVVDNDSNDKTIEAARRAGADMVISEVEHGTNMARECGRNAAQGRIIAFLDADTEPPPDWLARIEINLAHAVAVSGPYDYGLRGVRKLADKLYQNEGISLLPRMLRFFFRREAAVLVGGNFAAWAWALEEIGGLPRVKFWGDDTATAMLLVRNIGVVRFDPKLIVKTSPRRFEEDGFVRTAIRYAWVYLKIYFDPRYR